MPDSTAPLPSPGPSEGAGSTALTPAQPELSLVPPEPSRRERSFLNQTQQRSVQRFKQVLTAAREPAHADILNERAITPAFVAEIETDIMAAEKRVTLSITCTDRKEGATLDEQDAQAALLANLRTGQAAARQKYFYAEPAKLKEFLVGDRIDANRATLDQAAQAITTKLDQTRPPGIDTGFIEKLVLDRVKWNAEHATQATEQGQGTSERELRDAQIAAIQAKVHQIQFAADAAWPPGVPGNAGARRKFHLPRNRPFTP